MKIGILSMQHVRNYGSFLQAYALKSTLESLGHQCEFVELEKGEQLPGLKRNFLYLLKMAFKRYFNWSAISSFHKKWKFTKIYQNRFDNEFLPELGVYKHEMKEYECVVIGSDEVFNFNQRADYGFSIQLYGNVKNTKKVISYAGSFGTTTIAIIDSYGVRDKIISAMKRMSAISVRDTNSIEVVRNLLGVEPAFNIDPVLLYDYQKLAITPEETNYIVVYSYPNRIKGKDEVNAIRRFAQEKGMKLISICFFFPWCDETVVPHPFEVLGYIKNADYIITDTFHGCVMSMKFNKRFVALVRDSNRQKMTSLLNQFGLEARMCESFDDLCERMNADIDYVSINQQFEKEINKGIAYLNDALMN